MQNPDNASRVEFIHCTFQHQADHTIVPKGAKRQMHLGWVEHECGGISHMRATTRPHSGSPRLTDRRRAGCRAANGLTKELHSDGRTTIRSYRAATGNCKLVVTLTNSGRQITGRMTLGRETKTSAQVSVRSV